MRRRQAQESPSERGFRTSAPGMEVGVVVVLGPASTPSYEGRRRRMLRWRRRWSCGGGRGGEDDGGGCGAGGGGVRWR